MKRLLPLVLFITACGGGGAGKVVIQGDQSLLPIAERQVNEITAYARSRHSYTRLPDTINIRIVPHSPECDEISFLLPPYRVPYGTNYDGSIYDRDGATNGYVSLCAAGRFVESDSHIEVTEKGIRTTTVIRHEMQHLILWYNDRARYEATRIHLNGEDDLF